MCNLFMIVSFWTIIFWNVYFNYLLNFVEKIYFVLIYFIYKLNYNLFKKGFNRRSIISCIFDLSYAIFPPLIYNVIKNVFYIFKKLWCIFFTPIKSDKQTQTYWEANLIDFNILWVPAVCVWLVSLFVCRDASLVSILCRRDCLRFTKWPP